MSKQTAVQMLFDYIEANMHEDNFNLLSAKQTALAMEKEQIVDAWNGGDYAYFYSKETGRDFADGNEYYNETYGGGKDV